jgi:hypothetical protein
MADGGRTGTVHRTDVRDRCSSSHPSNTNTLFGSQAPAGTVSPPLTYGTSVRHPARERVCWARSIPSSLSRTSSTAAARRGFFSRTSIYHLVRPGTAERRTSRGRPKMACVTPFMAALFRRPLYLDKSATNRRSAHSAASAPLGPPGGTIWSDIGRRIRLSWGAPFQIALARCWRVIAVLFEQTC